MAGKQGRSAREWAAPKQASSGRGGAALRPPSYGVNFVDAPAVQSAAPERSQGGAASIGPGAVQLHGQGGELSARGVHAAAQHGLGGRGGALPFASAIQASFGQHDLSGVRAYIGGRASQACEAMGASAYASGNAVAFRERPDLHTAAHEAAHVVQQRAGVRLPGGVGRSGDAYERHADAVADRVVQGKSAEGLLSQQTGGGTADNVQQRAVQMGKTGRALKRGLNAFGALYRGGDGESGDIGLWSDFDFEKTPSDNDEAKQRDYRKLKALRVGVVLGNILTAGTGNLLALPYKMWSANRDHKKRKRKLEQLNRMRANN